MIYDLCLLTFILLTILLQYLIEEIGASCVGNQQTIARLQILEQQKDVLTQELYALMIHDEDI